MSFGRIIIDRYGMNIIDDVKTGVKELCLKKTEIINLFLNLSDTLTGIYTEQFGKRGFSLRVSCRVAFQMAMR